MVVLSMEAYENMRLESEIYVKLRDAEREDENGGKRYTLAEAQEKTRQAIDNV